MTKRAPSAILAAIVLLCVGSGRSRAAEGTETAGSAPEKDRLELHVGAWYSFEARTTAIKREYNDAGNDPNAGTQIVKDLVHKQSRHTLTPFLAAGAYNVELSFALPIVIADNRRLVFDQRADSCTFTGPNANCINRGNSLTLRDGLLPDGSSGPMGYDASDPSAGFSPDSTTVFRGVTRKGLDQLHIGLTWAPFNQREDWQKPTWVLGGQLRLSLGNIMKFDRDNPGAEDGVGRGVDELHVFTGVSRRTSWAEPYFFLWWRAPIGTKGRNPDDPGSSRYWDLGFGQQSSSKNPQQHAGVTFGFEAIPWEKKKEQQKLGLELRGRVEAHFEGLAYSPMWEVFSYAGDTGTNPTGPLVLDRDPVDPGNQALSHPGVTTVENYLTLGGMFGVRGQVGERARFSAAFDVSHDTKHRITFTDAGEEGPDADNVVTPGTDEVNPLHKPVVDLVGRRYIADDNVNFTFFVNATLLF